MGADRRRPMPHRTPRARRGSRLEDAGVALVAVVASMTLVATFLMLSLYVLLSNTTAARTGQDAKTAYAAAQAGLDEYVARLNATGGNYWTVGNNDPKNPALTTSGPGQRVQGTGKAGARYRYRVLNATEIAQRGRIRLQVTGISGPGQAGTVGASGTVTRTLTATLVPTGFLRFVYFSDVEVLDPALMSGPVFVRVDRAVGPRGSDGRYAMRPADACGLYHYQGRRTGFAAGVAGPPVGIWNPSRNQWDAAPGSITSGRVSDISCLDINWTSNDRVAGPLHSNDTLLVNGAVDFTDPQTESSWPYCEANPGADCWWGNGRPSNNLPEYARPLALPAGNQSLRTIAQDATKELGCYYTGATSITFTGSSMRVLSPNTTSAPTRCLNVAARGQAQTITPIPKVIYVDQASGSCTGVGYPRSQEWTGGVTTDYSCNRGTVFVQGQVTGQVTVASLDDTVITGDLTYTNGVAGTDITGLVAGNYVWIYHPVTSTGQNLPGYTPVHRVQAAALALRHSIIVQNWYSGAPLSTGTQSTRLNVTGSLAQKFRGPVGTGDAAGGIISGYEKNYVYDSRLRTLQPPYFLQPDRSPWVVDSIIDR